MNHNPEIDAASYLGGEMPASRIDAFERHLLECEGCWREVTEGREGRALAEFARELSPARFKEDLRAAIAAHQPVDAMRSRRHVGVAVAAIVLALASGGSMYLVARAPRQPRPIASAVADFKLSRMPVAGIPGRPAPDLSAAGFRLTSSGAGRVGDVAIDAFAYRDSAGQRVFLYLSTEPFPVAAGATRLAGKNGPWSAHDDGVELLCAQHPHALLLMSSRQETLRRAAKALGVS